VRFDIAIVSLHMLSKSEFKRERLRPNPWCERPWPQVFIISIYGIKMVMRVIWVSQGAIASCGLACHDVVARVVFVLTVVTRFCSVIAIIAVAA
jgi:hypothetical protein